MIFKEYWFTYLCFYLLLIIPVIVFSALQIYLSWGHFYLNDIGFWTIHLPFNLTIFTITYVGVLAIMATLCYINNRTTMK